MKNNSLDDIVQCNIEISDPVSGDESFDTILVVVPAPASGGTTMTKATGISSADELLDYGFASTDDAYVAATVAFSQSPAPNKLYICVRSKTDDVEDSITDVLTNAAAECNFYGIYICGCRDKDDIAAAIAYAEANEKLYGFEYTDIDDCPVSNFSYYRSFGIFAGLADGYDTDDRPAENAYSALAWMAKCFGYDPGSETWAMKGLSTIVPSALSTAQKEALEENNISTFRRYAGSNVTIGGATLAGEWIDVIRFRDWLKVTMQERVFNVLRLNRKVPFTDAGIALIEGAMDSTLAEGQEVGGIAPTEYDDDGNATPGYTVTVPAASDLTEAERKSRKLTGCKYTARLAGAIHVVEIEGYLTF